MSNEVLYRRWRPQSFGDVVGQEAITRTLTNAVAGGRVAHAYFFCGPRGTGKTSLGRLLAKAVNCAQPLGGDPCNVCDSCRAYLEGNAMDLVEMDAASNRGIDEIRRLRERVGLAPMGGRYKVYLIDEAHMLTQEADNALLKTLEEPPPHVIFVLATTEPFKVAPTVVSRCQRFDFRLIPAAAVRQRLGYICQREEIEAEDDVLQEIARSARGSLRDAINLLEQLSVSYGPSLRLEQVREALGLTADARVGELARRLVDRELAGGLEVICAVRDDGVDLRQFGRDLVAYLRGLLLTKAGVGEALDVPAEERQEMRRLAEKVEAEELLRGLRLFAQAEGREDAQGSLPLELALAEYVLGTPQGGGLRMAGREAAAAAVPRGRQAVPSPAVPQAREGEPTEDGQEGGDAGNLPPNFLEQLRLVCKEMDKHVAALLHGSCEVKSFEGDVLTLGFYFPFHKDKIEAPLSVKVVEGAASRLLGRKVAISCALTQRERREVVGRGGHLVRAARAMGAQPLHREPVEPVAAKGGDEGAAPDEP